MVSKASVGRKADAPTISKVELGDLMVPKAGVGRKTDALFVVPRDAGGRRRRTKRNPGTSRSRGGEKSPGRDAYFFAAAGP